MSGDNQFVFPPFTLDCANQSLFHAGEKVFLRAKSFAVLDYLVEHPHRLVSKEELKQAAWPGAKVVDAALRVSIQEIRKALGDNADEPQFIETAGKSGYRFVAAVSLKIANKQGGGLASSFVGRAGELEELREHLELARGGKRQVVFITGEPGIGKTALIDVFANNLTESKQIIVARGQCIEQHGAGEAYLPVLDVLEQLCRAADGQQMIALLRQLAPSWLLNLPAVISPEEREVLARQCLGLTAERRLREITAFFESISQDRTLILILEDLHWVDPSTLALISFVSRRREAARLMLIGTCRSGEVERSNSPVKSVAAELTLHHLCAHLALRPLSRSTVEQYLAARFNQQAVSRSVVSTVYARSEGNPLFMVNVTDYLVDREAIVREKDSIKLVGISDQQSVPGTIRDLINRQFEALADEDRELLETASVAGITFPILLVARLLGRARESVERRCHELAEREQFLQYAGSRRRPSGTPSALCSFTHALYHNVIYDRVGESKRRRLHQSIGEGLEQVFQGATEQLAAELALHFERAGDYSRAMRYLIQAAQKAAQQSAYQEAIDYAISGLQLLKSLPDSPHRDEMELHLQVTLGVSLASTQGYAVAKVSDAYNQANQLCEKVKNESLRVQALNGLWSFHLLRGEPRKALDFGKQMILAAHRTEDAAAEGEGHTCTGIAHFYLGEFLKAEEHFNQAIAACSLENGKPVTASRPDVLAFLFTYSAVTLWLMGYPARAEGKRGRALFIAQKLSHPLGHVITQLMICGYHQCRREAIEAGKLFGEGIKRSNEYGLAHWLAGGTMLKGWALASLGQSDEGISLLREGLKNWRAIGSKTETARFIYLLADAYLLASRIKEGLSLVDEALSLIEETEDRFYQSELTRLRGELLLRIKPRAGKHPDRSEAESQFLKAIEIAQRQKAKSFELRATISLARLWQKTGKSKEAKRMLAKIYGWFTEGFDTPDLKAAKELLASLG